MKAESTARVDAEAAYQEGLQRFKASQ